MSLKIGLSTAALVLGLLDANVDVSSGKAKDDIQKILARGGPGASPETRFIHSKNKSNYFGLIRAITDYYLPQSK